MDLLNTEEAAAFMHVPLQTLRHWIAVGKAPASAKIGRRLFFRQSVVEAFIDAKFAQAEVDALLRPIPAAGVAS